MCNASLLRAPRPVATSPYTFAQILFVLDVLPVNHYMQSCVWCVEAVCYEVMSNAHVCANVVSTVVHKIHFNIERIFAFIFFAKNISTH